MKSSTSKASNLRHVAVYGQKNRQGRRWELEGIPQQLRKALRIAVQHPPKNRFPRYNPYPRVVLGDWDNDIVKVDWDERRLAEVKLLSRLINERYSLDGFIILRSSTTTRGRLEAKTFLMSVIVIELQVIILFSTVKSQEMS